MEHVAIWRPLTLARAAHGWRSAGSASPSSEDPALTGALVFTPSHGDDGLLRVAEILELSLDAELAVLSAYNTGQGRPTSDGVSGLSPALISAGVPSLLVSLWPVQDEATAFLMTAFYENLEQVGDKAMALRQAMLTTMRQDRLFRGARAEEGRAADVARDGFGFAAGIFEGWQGRTLRQLW